MISATSMLHNSKRKYFVLNDNTLLETICFLFLRFFFCLFVLRLYGPVNPMESYQVRSVYLSAFLLGRLSPLSC